MPQHFADRLATAVNAADSRVCVGLDPQPDLLPSHLRAAPDAAAAAVEFCTGIIDATAEFAACFKPQAAYFEALCPDGLAALWEVVSYAKTAGLPVIFDCKRNDIGSTAAAYARACFGLHHQAAPAQADAVTVNPYLGSDGVRPFLEVSDEIGGGVFVLVKTSNPSSGELQDLSTPGGSVYETMAALVNEWAREDGRLGACGYSSVGAVVGATYPEQLAALRGLMRESILLVPGYGAQGATAHDVAAGFDADGLGAVVNSSRGILYAYRETGQDYKAAAAEAARRMRDEINSVLP